MKERYEELLKNHTSTSLHIARLPPEVKKEFKEFAKQDFCNDFGFAFKHIWDTYKGLINVEQQEILNRLFELEMIVEELRAVQPQAAKVQDVKKPIKSLRGNTIKE